MISHFPTLAAGIPSFSFDSMWGILVCVVVPMVVILLGLRQGKQNATRADRRLARQRDIAQGRKVPSTAPRVAQGSSTRRPAAVHGGRRRSPAAV